MYDILMTTKFVYRTEKKSNNNKNNSNKNNNKPKKAKPKEFIYKYANGTLISNDDTLKRIKSIGCPPAWRNVEINPNANAELGCTGYDKAGRKQWRYTRLHDERIEKEKFCKLIDFGKKLPKIRSKYKKILASKSGTKKTRMIALILKIIESCHFRIGTEAGRKTYDHYGMTTLLKNHVKIKSNKSAVIDFIGKKGVKNICKIKDPEVIKLLSEIQYNASNKEKIFKYQNSRKGTSYITFLDVNNFLCEFGEFTSKIFRTWAANKYLLEELDKHPISDKVTHRKKTLRESIKIVADNLHHEVAACKGKYLCPDLRELYEKEPEKFKEFLKDNKLTPGLDKYESIFLNFLNKYYNNKYCKNMSKRSKKENINKPLNLNKKKHNNRHKKNVNNLKKSKTKNKKK